MLLLSLAGSLPVLLEARYDNEDLDGAGIQRSGSTDKAQHFTLTLHADRKPQEGRPAMLRNTWLAWRGISRDHGAELVARIMRNTYV